LLPFSVPFPKLGWSLSLLWFSPSPVLTWERVYVEYYVCASWPRHKWCRDLPLPVVGGGGHWGAKEKIVGGLGCDVSHHCTLGPLHFRSTCVFFAPPFSQNVYQRWSQEFIKIRAQPMRFVESSNFPWIFEWIYKGWRQA
jgi:hypothetical protein